MVDSSKIMDALGCKNLQEAYKLHGIEAIVSEHDPVMCAVSHS